jgi:hypothetical protein
MDISSIVNSTSSTDASNDADKTALLSAIDSANLNRVRTVLREICLANPEAFKLASAKLLVSPEKLDAVNKTTESNGAGSKRKAQHRYETCVQCNSEYDVLDNPENACVWHEGTCSLFLYPSYLLCAFPSRALAFMKVLIAAQAKRNQTTTATSGPTMTRIATVKLTPTTCGRSFPRGSFGVVVRRAGRRRGVG